MSESVKHDLESAAFIRQTARGRAAAQIAELLTNSVIGDLIDRVNDSDLRDLTMKVVIKCRAIAADEQQTATK